MKTHRRLAGALLGCWLAGMAGEVSAQGVRMVLIAEELRDGKPAQQGALESTATALLQARDVRLVELDAALRAQSLAFAATLEEGKVPRELTVLNADAALSLRLQCDRSSAAVMGSGLVAYYCVLGSKLVRLDTGDIISSQSAGLTGHGLNAAMAIDAVLKSRGAEVIAAHADTALARLRAAESWEVDLVVTRVSDRATAAALAAQVAEQPGIAAARLVLWNRGTAKYTLSGKGRLALDQLADAVDRDPDLALTVTYQVERALHAEYDFAKAYRRRVMVMSVAALDATSDELAPQIVSSALMNLPYLEMAHSRPLLATPESERALSERLRDKAAELSVPLMLVCRFAQQGEAWSAGMKLVHVASGRTVAAATGEGRGVAEAVDQAVRAFDDRFRGALTRASIRARLGLESATVTGVSASGLTIAAFRVPTFQAALQQPASEGALELKNTSREPIEDVRVVVEAAGKRVLERALPTLAPLASSVLAVPLSEVTIGDDGLVAVSATLSYRQGERRGIASAFASLVARTPVPPGGKPGGSPPDGYEALMRSGLEHALAGRFEQAHTDFTRAHALRPNARTLRALGLVEFDLGHRERATQMLREALAHREQPLTDQQRREVEITLGRLR